MEGSEPLNVRFTENPLSIVRYEITHLQFRPLVFVKSEPFSYAPCWSFFPLSLIQNIYKYLLHEIHTHLSVYFVLWDITNFSGEWNILDNKNHQYISQMFVHERIKPSQIKQTTYTYQPGSIRVHEQIKDWNYHHIIWVFEYMRIQHKRYT